MMNPKINMNNVNNKDKDKVASESLPKKKKTEDMSAYQRAYYQKYKERLKKYKMNWRLNNPNYQKQWRRAHPDYQKQYTHTHPEQIRQYQRAYYQKNKEKLNAYYRSYRHQHKLLKTHSDENPTA